MIRDASKSFIMVLLWKSFCQEWLVQELMSALYAKETGSTTIRSIWMAKMVKADTKYLNEDMLL